MVNYWIFVSVPYTDFNTGDFLKIYRKIKVSKKWSIGKKTPNRKKLSKNDEILFYQGGERGGKFVGSAELVSGLIQQDNGMFDFVILKNIEFWKKPVEIRPILRKLSFIKDKKHWGVYFQGGIIRISEKDYEEILKRAGK